MSDWLPTPEKPDDTYASTGEGTVSWLRRSTLPLADDCRKFLTAGCVDIDPIRNAGTKGEANAYSERHFMMRHASGSRTLKFAVNRNLSLLPKYCREDIFNHLCHEQHHKDGFFELVVVRTLQELGADIECAPINPVDGSRVDFVGRFPDRTVFVEAVSPRLEGVMNPS